MVFPLPRRGGNGPPITRSSTEPESPPPIGGPHSASVRRPPPLPEAHALIPIDHECTRPRFAPPGRSPSVPGVASPPHRSNSAGLPHRTASAPNFAMPRHNGGGVTARADRHATHSSLFLLCRVICACLLFSAVTLKFRFSHAQKSGFHSLSVLPGLSPASPSPSALGTCLQWPLPRDRDLLPRPWIPSHHLTGCPHPVPPTLSSYPLPRSSHRERLAPWA